MKVITNTSLKHRTKFPAVTILVGLFFPVALFSSVAFDAHAELFESDFVIQEIIISAQKFEQSLQATPVAVTVVTADMMLEKGIANVADTLENTPGATFASFSKSQQEFSLRGISSGSEGAASDSATLTLVDGVVIARTFAHSANLFDVARIEVLRGPQGTLYGKNAVAGLMHIISNKPTEKLEGYYQASLGNYQRYSVEGAISGPLAENVLGRLSLHANGRDGYTEDVSSGDDLDSVENHSLRGQLAFKPSDQLSILLRVDYARDNDGATPRKPINPKAPYDSAFTAYTDGSDDPWKVDNSDVDFYLDRTISGISADIQWDMGSMALTSITAYRKAESEALLDPFGSPDALVWSFEKEDASQWTQELRLDNAISADKLRWQLGLYLLHEDIDRLDRFHLFAETPALETVRPSNQRVTTDSWGLFAQGTYAVGVETDLTVGLRYSRDKKDFKVFNESVGPFTGLLLDESPVFTHAADEQWDAVTGVMTLDHQIAESSKFYATLSLGYKAGGFNTEASTNASVVIPYDEERVLNYELGTKTEWYDRRLQVNVALFSMDYDDIQVEAFTPGTVFIDNAGKASIDGLELEMTALVTEMLALVASYAWLDATYDKYISGSDDFSGNRLVNSPEWTGYPVSDL